MKHYNCDNSHARAILLEKQSIVGALPRRTVYGQAPGIDPFGERFPDKLVQPADYKEVILDCHKKKIFPVYHQHVSWAPPGFQWDQDGLGFCWAWSLTGNLMDLRAREGKPTVLLSPVSLGWLVNWRNQGNYLESAIRGIKERGVCSMEYTPDPHSLNYRQYKEGWEEDALDHRLAEVWDLDNGSDARMIQHAISVLATGSSLHICYLWWGHALNCCGLRWDETKRNNLVWIIRNSHAEDDVIEFGAT